MKEPEPIRHSTGLTDRIRSKGTDLSLFAEELEELVDKVSDFFPNQPPEDFLHIFVTVCECYSDRRANSADVLFDCSTRFRLIVHVSPYL
jgi:hypothetical protein